MVTGATGFIAQHCIQQLLDAGYRVRGTARSSGRTQEVAAIVAPHLSGAARDRLADDFEIVAADLTADAGWADAARGCRYVLHVASPVPRTPPKNDDDLIVPARDGALRVLRAAADGGVERVVLTSSIAAIIYQGDRDRTFTEADWSDLGDKRIGAYAKSKTIAERAAWDYVNEISGAVRTELVTINPGFVMGPLLSEDWGTSGELIKKIVDRDVPAIPDINYAVVDVRDVAAAHVAAMTVPGAAGQRFICAIENHSMREIAQILDEHLSPQGFRIPTGKLPALAMRIVALWDRTARLGLSSLGVRQDLDSSKARSMLDWQPRDLKEMTIAMADSMIEYGVVEAPRTR
ncbi:MAG: SDR family oxidoreductase, partial [Nocardioides sp.]